MKGYELSDAISDGMKCNWALSPDDSASVLTGFRLL
jgi:hypothetical protein